MKNGMGKKPKSIILESIESDSYVLSPFEIISDDERDVKGALSSEQWLKNYAAFTDKLRPRRVWFKPWTWLR